MKLLLLGGTTESRELTEILNEVPGLHLITSVAGRTRQPTTRGEALAPEASPVPGRAPVPQPGFGGVVRRGGFGGAEGLVEWLRVNQVDAVLDATHPFAATMTAHAVEATSRLGLPYLVLRRPGWTESRGDRWYRVPTVEAAAEWLDRNAVGKRVLLTIGRQGLDAFAGCGLPMVARCIEAPDPRPDWCELILDRGPYELAAERELLRSFDLLVTKDSGGPMTAAKLTAARELDLPVLVVQRPPLPPHVPSVPTVSAALTWIRELRTSGGTNPRQARTRFHAGRAGR